MLSRCALRRHNGRSLGPPRLWSLPPSPPRRQGTRLITTVAVTDADIARLAAEPLHPLTLADLCKHGRPPLTTEQLLSSANFTLSILPPRLAHRIQSLRSLPYIVMSNPNVAKIHSNYVHSLSTLLPLARGRIESLAEEVAFTDVMSDLVQTHSNTIAVLAKGFIEARKYISARAITAFLDEHLRARIGTRLVAEQHIALHLSSRPYLTEVQEAGITAERPREKDHFSHDSYIGVIDTALRPADIVRSCEQTVGEICELKYGVRPSVRIVGCPDATIAHIPMHLEYIITELLKNSFRAIIEAGMEKEPVEVTIAPAPALEKTKTSSTDMAAAPPKTPNQCTIPSDYQGAGDCASSLLSQGSPPPQSAESLQVPSDHQLRTSSTWSPDVTSLAHDASTPGVTIRIRDRGGGISPENYAHLWEYGFTTFKEDAILEKTGVATGSGLDMISSGAAGGGSSLAGLGYGLPLGRAYAEYFGGGIAIQSMWGWGTDVYLSLRGVGDIR